MKWPTTLLPLLLPLVAVMLGRLPSVVAAPGDCLEPGATPVESNCEAKFPTVECSIGTFTTCPSVINTCRGMCNGNCGCRSRLQGCTGGLSNICLSEVSCAENPLPPCVPGYVAHDTAGCDGKNELGEFDVPTVADCADLCDANDECVSFEYLKSGTACFLSSTCVQLEPSDASYMDDYYWYPKASKMTTKAPTQSPTKSPTNAPRPLWSPPLDVSEQCQEALARSVPEDSNEILLAALRNTKVRDFPHPYVMKNIRLMQIPPIPALEEACRAAGGNVTRASLGPFQCGEDDSDWWEDSDSWQFSFALRGVPNCDLPACAGEEGASFGSTFFPSIVPFLFYGQTDIQCRVSDRCEVARPEDIGGGICDGVIYNTAACEFDGGDCQEFNTLYPFCDVRNPRLIGDGKCNNGEYNTEECGWDGGDCLEFNEQYPNCTAAFPDNIGDGVCHDGGFYADKGYNTEECGWDGGDCTAYAEKYPDCDVELVYYIGNGRCNKDEDGDVFNSEACGWDGGDCPDPNAADVEAIEEPSVSTPAPTSTPTPEPSNAPTPAPTGAPIPEPESGNSWLANTLDALLNTESNEETSVPLSESSIDEATEPQAEIPLLDANGSIVPEEPTLNPTPQPTFKPTRAPTPQPTFRPTRAPTPQPTFKPTRAPTPQPTSAPTFSPTSRPTWTWLSSSRKATLEPEAAPTEDRSYEATNLKKSDVSQPDPVAETQLGDSSQAPRYLWRQTGALVGHGMLLLSLLTFV